MGCAAWGRGARGSHDRWYQCVVRTGITTRSVPSRAPDAPRVGGAWSQPLPANESVACDETVLIHIVVRPVPR